MEALGCVSSSRFSALECNCWENCFHRSAKPGETIKDWCSHLQSNRDCSSENGAQLQLRQWGYNERQWVIAEGNGV